MIETKSLINADAATQDGGEPGVGGLRAHPEAILGSHCLAVWSSPGEGLGRGNKVNVGASLQLGSGLNISQAVVELGNSDLAVRELGTF